MKKVANCKENGKRMLLADQLHRIYDATFNTTNIKTK